MRTVLPENLRSFSSSLAGLSFWDGTVNSASYRKNNLSFTAGTANIISAAPAWTPTGAALYLRAKGVFRRETVQVWMFQ